MSKGKKGNKPTSDREVVNWDEELLKVTVEEDDWRPYIALVCPFSPHEDGDVELLRTAVDGGKRRRFSIIDQTTLLESASEDLKLAQAAVSGGGKKSKLAVGAPSVEKPLFWEVCEHVVDALHSGNPVPPPLLARMLKYKVLRQKMFDKAEANIKDAEMAKRQEATEGKGGGRDKSGQTKKAGGGKKGNETPSTGVSSALPLPAKTISAMMKRGEEENISKYCDDEPSDGPSRYFILTGFSSLEFLQALETVGLRAHVLLKFINPHPSSTGQEDISEEQKSKYEQHASDLHRFWNHLNLTVKSSPAGSMLKHMAQLELQVPHSVSPEIDDAKLPYTENLYDTVAEKLYCVVEQYNQYQHYINLLSLWQLPLFTTPTEVSDPLAAPSNTRTIGWRVDTRLYDELLSTVPQEALTVPLILYCMEEQVCKSTSANSSIHSFESQGIHPNVSEEINETITALSLGNKEKNVLPHQSVKGSPKNEPNISVIEYWDKIKQLTYPSDLRPLSVESFQSKINSKSIFSFILEPPTTCGVEQDAYLTELNALEHFCTSDEVSPWLLSYALILYSLEHAQLPTASLFPEPKQSSFIFDYPLSANINIQPMLRPQCGLRTGSGSNTTTMPYELDLSLPINPLPNHNVCEPMSKNALVQLLQSLQWSHPYLSIYHHSLSQSTVVVAHTGFDGKQMYTHSWSCQAHSKVGFNNYLKHVVHSFGSLVNKAVEDNIQRKEAFEVEKHKSIQERNRALQQNEKTVKKEVSEASKVSAQSKKDSVAINTPVISGEKGNPATPTETLLDNTLVDTSLPMFDEQKIFVAYDVGDTPIQKNGSSTVLFIGDGIQVRTEKSFPADCNAPETDIMVSIMSSGHVITCDMIKEKQESELSDDLDTSQNVKNGHDKENKSNEVIAAIPQPPPEIKFAALTATFQESLTVVVSYFGLNGNGQLPFKPRKPSALLSPDPPDITLESRPQSRQIPQKLSKKQAEQQQQLLQQQQQLEEQRKKNRDEAEREYQSHCTALMRQNKYQQLMASTPYGLHVQFHMIIDLEADSLVSDGSDASIFVKQYYPMKSQGAKESEAKCISNAYSEKERQYMPDGSVICCMKNGLISILCADGYVYQIANKALSDYYLHKINSNQHNTGNTIDEREIHTTFSAARATIADIPSATSGDNLDVIWLITTPTGNRYLWEQKLPSTSDNEAKKNIGQDTENTQESTSLPDENPNQTQPTPCIVNLPSLKIIQATDPVTKEVLITREDGVTILKKSDGSTITEHANGTRITIYQKIQSITSSSVMIESPGFASVSYATKCHVDFPDGSQITCSNAGGYTIQMEGNYWLEVNPDGLSQCRLQPNLSSYIFHMDHTGTSDILKVMHHVSGVKCLVNTEGNASIEKEHYIPAHPAYLPHYFVVPSSGLPYQILSVEEMESYISEAKSIPHTTIHEHVTTEFEGKAITVLEPLQHMSSTLPYKKESLIPSNLASDSSNWDASTTGLVTQKRFGVGVGNGLSIKCNENNENIPESQLCNNLKCRQFVHIKEVTGSVCAQVFNGLAKYLVAKNEAQITANDNLPMDYRKNAEKRAQNNLKVQWLSRMVNNALQVQQRSEPTASNTLVSHKTPTPEEPFGKKMCVKNNFSEIETHKLALRNHSVPQYFESSAVHKVGSQSPDMAELTLKLAHSKCSSKLPRIGDDFSLPSTPSTLQSASITLPPAGADSPFSDICENGIISPSPSKVRPAHPTPNHSQGMCSPTNVRPTNPTPFHASRQHSPSSSSSVQTRAGGNPMESTHPSHRHTDVTASDEVTHHDVTCLFATAGDQEANTLKVISEKTISKNEIEKQAINKKRKAKSPQPNTFGAKVKYKASSSGQSRGIVVHPSEVNFGTVIEGCSYSQTLTLKNMGGNSTRFKIKSPPPSTGIKAIYTPGPVAAGMTRKFTVELFAIAAEAVRKKRTGQICYSLEIISEANILHLPVHATVLSSSTDDDIHKTSFPQKASFKEVNQPSRKDDIIRARSQD